MSGILNKILILSLLLGMNAAHAIVTLPYAMSNAQIKEQIIKHSINDFYKQDKSTKPCPCPYNSGSDGQTCGGESAYYQQNLKNIGTTFVLKCYPRDVTAEDIMQFRIEHGIPERVLNPR